MRSLQWLYSSEVQQPTQPHPTDMPRSPRLTSRTDLSDRPAYSSHRVVRRLGDNLTRSWTPPNLWPSLTRTGRSYGLRQVDHRRRVLDPLLMTTSPAGPASDMQDRVRVLWEALRDERANQYARLDAYNVGSTALLGFQAVLVTLVPDLSVPLGWRVAAMAALSLSIVALLWCVVGHPRKGPESWRKRSKGELARVEPHRIHTYLTRGADQVLYQMYVNEAAMVDRNDRWLLAPKRRTLQVGVWLFAIAFVLLLAGALHQLVRG